MKSKQQKEYNNLSLKKKIRYKNRTLVNFEQGFKVNIGGHITIIKNGELFIV